MAKPSITKNLVMNIILKVSTFVFPLITFPYASRVLGPDGIGKVAFASSVVAYYFLVSQLGVPIYGLREVATVRDDKRLLSKLTIEILIINLFMSFVVCIILILSVFVVPKFENYKLLIIISGTQILFSAIGVEWLYQGLEKYSFITIRSLLIKISSVILLYALVRTEGDYIRYSLISAFGVSASNIFNFVHLRKEISLRAIDKIEIKKHIMPILVFFAMTCATTVYNNIDSTMLGFMTTDSDVGYYNAAIKMKVILVQGVTALGAVLLPRLSNYIETNKGEFWRLTKKSMHYSVLISLPLMCFFVLYAKDCIFLLSGEKYEKSIVPMQILMATLPIIGISHVLGMQILLPLRKEKKVLHAAIIGAVIDLIINSILIPGMKSTGAAIGTVIAEICTLAFEIYILRDKIKLIICEVEWSKIGLALILSIVTIVFLHRIQLPPFISLAIGSVSFFSIYFATLLACKNEIIITGMHKILHFVMKLGKKGA